MRRVFKEKADRLNVSFTLNDEDDTCTGARARRRHEANKKNTSKDGAKYILPFVDDYSR